MSGLHRKAVVMSSVMEVMTVSLMVQLNYAVMTMWIELMQPTKATGYLSASILLEQIKEHILFVLFSVSVQS